MTNTNMLRGFAAYLLGKGFEVAPAHDTQAREEWSDGWRRARDASVLQQECIAAGLIDMSEDGQAIYEPNEECETASQAHTGAKD